ncbi:hypothetical protein CBR_g51806 [Chara braunii]|uniref:Uncharacterized protein n=1 Tax=Chara braunii TaxID=69332 RepID=A0A388M9D3_CHABU|nr:hypothetical protein CBR_g51806 [Chara braunii]|eukprot:GBG91072.1 hypothetical protein CBR_g51806 [Chara braunii]
MFLFCIFIAVDCTIVCGTSIVVIVVVVVIVALHCTACFSASRLVSQRAVVLCAMSSRGAGRGKTATNQAMEVAVREKKGRHSANKKRKFVQGGPSGAGSTADDEWVGEEVAPQEESDFEEEEEAPLRRTGGGLRIEEGGYEAPAERRRRHRRGSHTGADDVIDMEAEAASREGVAGGVVQPHRAPVSRVNDAPDAHEPVVCARTSATSRPRTTADVGGSLQAIAQGNRNRSPAQEAQGAVVGGASHAGDVVTAGDVGGEGENDEALVNRVLRRDRRDVMEAASKLWVDDLRFWNETQGNVIVKLIQEARLHLVDVARGVQHPPVRRSIVLPHNSIPQHKIDNEMELNAAKEREFKVQTISLRVIHGWVFKSKSRQRGYHAAYGPMVFHTTLDMDMKLSVWFVGADTEDRHENDEMASYQEASIQRLVAAFTSVVSMAEGIDGRRVSYDRLKNIVDAMRILLTTTMWLMRMSGDDLRAHYDSWLFVQLTLKPMLVASMHRSFDAHRHILQAATVVTDKLAKPPMTLVDPPLYIPD